MTIDELARMPAGADRFAVVSAYIESGEEKLRVARRLRDEDLRVMAAEHGKAKAAALAGVSLSTVKNAVGRP